MGLKSSTAFLSRDQKQELSHAGVMQILETAEDARNHVSQIKAEPLDKQRRVLTCTEPAPPFLLAPMLRPPGSSKVGQRRRVAFEAFFLTGARLLRFTLEAAVLRAAGFLRAVLACDFLLLGFMFLDGFRPAADTRFSVVLVRRLVTALTFIRALVLLALAREGFGDLGGDLVFLARRLGGASSAVISTMASTSGGGLCSAPSLQPWASRTAIIADRMLFHVPASFITAFGNMQPSQQTWLNALLGWPDSSRSQKPEWCGILSLPFGSSGRQWWPVLSCVPEPFTVASF